MDSRSNSPSLRFPDDLPDDGDPFPPFSNRKNRAKFDPNRSLSDRSTSIKFRKQEASFVEEGPMFEEGIDIPPALRYSFDEDIRRIPVGEDPPGEARFFPEIRMKEESGDILAKKIKKKRGRPRKNPAEPRLRPTRPRDPSQNAVGETGRRPRRDAPQGAQEAPREGEPENLEEFDSEGGSLKNLSVKNEKAQRQHERILDEINFEKKAHLRNYVCQFCARAFETGSGLGGHMSKTHPGQSEDYNYKKAISNTKIVMREKNKRMKAMILEIKKGPAFWGN